MQRPELSESQRSEAARVAAVIEQRDDVTTQALWEVTGDSVVLGEVLGDYLHNVVVGTQAETIRYWPILELLRAAGADEERAAAKSLWLRHQEAQLSR